MFKMKSLTSPTGMTLLTDCGSLLGVGDALARTVASNKVLKSPSGSRWRPIGVDARCDGAPFFQFFPFNAQTSNGLAAHDTMAHFYDYSYGSPPETPTAHSVSGTIIMEQHLVIAADLLREIGLHGASREACDALAMILQSARNLCTTSRVPSSRVGRFFSLPFYVQPDRYGVRAIDKTANVHTYTSLSSSDTIELVRMTNIHTAASILLEHARARRNDGESHYKYERLRSHFHPLDFFEMWRLIAVGGVEVEDGTSNDHFVSPVYDDGILPFLAILMEDDPSRCVFDSVGEAWAGRVLSDALPHVRTTFVRSTNLESATTEILAGVGVRFIRELQAASCAALVVRKCLVKLPVIRADALPVLGLCIQRIAERVCAIPCAISLVMTIYPEARAYLETLRPSLADLCHRAGRGRIQVPLDMFVSRVCIKTLPLAQRLWGRRRLLHDDAHSPYVPDEDVYHGMTCMLKSLHGRDYRSGSPTAVEDYMRALAVFARDGQILAVQHALSDARRLVGHRTVRRVVRHVTERLLDAQELSLDDVRHRYQRLGMSRTSPRHQVQPARRVLRALIAEVVQKKDAPSPPRMLNAHLDLTKQDKEQVESWTTKACLRHHTDLERTVQTACRGVQSVAF